MLNEIPMYLCGKNVIANYFDVEVKGIVIESRVKYGNEMSHYIQLLNPVEVFGSVREYCIVKHEDIVSIA